MACLENAYLLNLLVHILNAQYMGNSDIVYKLRVEYV